MCEVHQDRAHSFTPVTSVLVSPLAADHQAQNSYAEFEDEFDDVERQCTVLYNFEGTFQPVSLHSSYWRSLFLHLHKSRDPVELTLGEGEIAFS